MRKLAVLALCLLVSVCSAPVVARADSQRIVTLGEDLSDAQRSEVLKFFGLSESDLETMDVVTVNNQEEHETLDGLMPADVIGKHTYSCSYIEPTASGGITIKTANLNYVTSISLFNALQTAGVQNCNLIVTAPFEVSGTGALTGVYKAYSKLGIELDDEKKAVATEELVVGAELEDKYGQEALGIVADVKNSVVKHENDLSMEEIKSIVEAKSFEHGVSLKDEDVAQIASLVDKLQGMEYDVGTFEQKMGEVREKVEAAQEKAGGILEAIGRFFQAIIDFFKNLFGLGGSDDVQQDADVPTIFDNVDTGVFQYDGESETQDENTDFTVPSGNVDDSEPSDDSSSAEPAGNTGTVEGNGPAAGTSGSMDEADTSQDAGIENAQPMGEAADSVNTVKETEIGGGTPETPSE